MKFKATTTVAVLAALLMTATAVTAEDVSFYGRTNGKDKPVFTRQQPAASSFSLADVLPASSDAVSAARSAEEKIHPDLKAIRDRGGAERIRVVIEFPEHLTMSSFPPRDRTKPLDHPVNQAILQQRRARSEQILQARLARNGPVVGELQALGVSVVEQFWITNSILVEMPVAVVDKLAARADVISLAPEHTTVQPPTVRAGRDIIRSDYIGSSAWYHWNYILIALLDTGTALTAQNTTMHTQFDPPNQIGGFDCVNGTNTGCSTGYNLNPADDCWNHGLSSSAIITGNNNLGDTYRGVSNFTVYSFKVYDQNGSGPGCTSANGVPLGLNTPAAQRGFQAAVNMGLDIIVAEIQDWKGSVLTTAADNAFDAGSAVIAAAGNQAGTGTVRSPGEAHKAIAVGAVDYLSLMTESYQGRGPEADGRIKPDIQGPTNTTTASNTGFTQLRSFSGTSGSTPYAAASAGILSYWLSPYGVAPGHIYAQLINYGRNMTDPTSNNTTGAGLLQLQNGPADNWWGVVSVSAGQTAIVSIPIGSTRSVIDAAIWWPEPTTLHNNIDLRLRNPSGTTVRTSASVNSVFEKFRYSGTVSTGTWQIRITGATVSGTQQVYYAVQAR